MLAPCAFGFLIGGRMVAPIQTLKLPAAVHARLVRHVLRQQPEDSQTIDGALQETRRRRFFEIAHRHGDFVNPQLRSHGLRNNFLIENKAIGIHFEIHRLQAPTGETRDTRCDIPNDSAIRSTEAT